MYCTARHPYLSYCISCSTRISLNIISFQCVKFNRAFHIHDLRDLVTMSIRHSLCMCKMWLDDLENAAFTCGNFDENSYHFYHKCKLYRTVHEFCSPYSKYSYVTIETYKYSYSLRYSRFAVLWRDESFINIFFFFEGIFTKYFGVKIAFSISFTL